MQKKILAGAAALVVLGISAGGAFTASNTVPTTVAGYGSNTVTGASVTSIDYTYDPDMTTITNAKLVFTASQSANTVKAGFNTDAPTDCTEDTTDTTGATFNCVFTQSVATADDFNVSVS